MTIGVRLLVALACLPACAAEPPPSPASPSDQAATPARAATPVPPDESAKPPGEAWFCFRVFSARSSLCDRTLQLCTLERDYFIEGLKKSGTPGPDSTKGTKGTKSEEVQFSECSSQPHAMCFTYHDKVRTEVRYRCNGTTASCVSSLAHFREKGGEVDRVSDCGEW